MIKHALRGLVWIAVFSLSAWWLSAGAVVIEGTTPSGKFKTVGLDEQGHLLVAVGTGSVITHVITDTGSVVNVLGAVEVKGNALAVPVPVSGPGGAAIPVSGSFSATVAASTSSTNTSAQVGISNIAFQIIAVDATRKQSIVCNGDTTGLTVWLGPAGVTTATGIPLGAGGCMTPDLPTSYIGSLFGISSAASSGFMGTLEFH